MDDTTQSRKSDAAATTRKRRSSILKAARASRAPLSELEFNVPTPTDITKGRRVSFSRRNNVAEFATHEATTTWKNLYEEQNRTLESSVNESAERPRVQQLGGSSRLIDQQFQEVIAINFDTSRGANVESSISQIVLGNLDLSNTIHPTPLQQKFELSCLTDQQSKVFGDELAHSGMAELTDKLSFNFSTLQPLGANQKDDLEQMEDDLLNHTINHQGNVVCQGPNMGDVSEYIEVDLNTTRVGARIEESDMSITDTIHSPKVQDVSKSTSSISNEKPGKDWVIDKENIVLNPYVAPKETDNFAVNEETDKVLVFDGKRLTIQSNKDINKINDINMSMDQKVSEKKMPQRKTIVLNVNDDLPNFLDDVDVSRLPNFVENESILSVKNDLSSNKTLDDSTTKLIDQMLDMYETSTVNLEKQKISNISVTQSKICDISMTQALPSNIIANDSDKRKTIVYQADAGDLSVTQAVPSLILPGSLPERRKTIVDENKIDNISMTQALPSNILSETNTQEKRKTIVFQDDKADVSITQAVPANLILPEKDATYKIPSDNISVTQNDSSDQVLKTSGRRQTIIYAEEEGDISMTEAIPANLLDNVAPAKRRETIVFENDMADISATQAIDGNLILAQLPEEQIATTEEQIPVMKKATFEKRFTIDESSLSIHEQDRRKTVVFEADDADISMTQAVKSNIVTEIIETMTQKRKTIVFEDADADISVTKPIPSNIILAAMQQLSTPDSDPEKNKCEKMALVKDTNAYTVEDDDANMSISEAAPAGQGLLDILEKEHDIEMTQALTTSISSAQVLQGSSGHTLTESFLSHSISSCGINKKSSSNDGDVSMTQESDEIILKPLKAVLKVPDKIFTNQPTVDALNLADIDAYLPCGQYNIDVQNMKTNGRINPKSTSPKKRSLKANQMSAEAQHILDTLVYQNNTDNSSNPVALNAPNNFVLEDKSSSNISSRDIPLSTAQTTQLDDIPNMKITHPIIDTIEEIDEQSKTEREDPESKSVGVMASIETVHSDSLEIQPISLTFQLENKSSTVRDSAQERHDESTTEEPQIRSVEPEASINTMSSDFTNEEDVKKSLLNNLLDMTNASLDIPGDGYEDKGVMAKFEGSPTISTVENSEPTKSDESFFYIRDMDDETKIDKLVKQRLEVRVPLQIAYRESEKEKYANMSPRPAPVTIEIKRSPQGNRYFEKIRSPDVEVEYEKRDLRDLRDPDNTRALIKMLEHFTDREEEENPIQPLIFKQLPALKSSRLSSRTQSPPKSDLLSSVTMSQKVTEDEQMADSIVTDKASCYNTLYQCPSPKAVQVPGDVVKTLRFEDDESLTEVTQPAKLETTPLKKTAFGEMSYMKQEKGVIPNYLRDVADGLKELMEDLVKPMADKLPFNASTRAYGGRKPSTCSAQVEANLITSSQIDVDSDTLSASEHQNNIDDWMENSEPAPSSSKPVPPTKVIVFDRENPLNNVLIPIDYSSGHRYNPIKNEVPALEQTSEEKYEESTTDVKESFDFNVETAVTEYNHMHGGETVDKKKKKTESREFINDKAASTGAQKDTQLSIMKSAEVNTVIAMKENKQILQESSSLTLIESSKKVDDVIVKDNEASNSMSTILTNRSPVQVLYVSSLSVSRPSSQLASYETIHESRMKKRPYSAPKCVKKTSSSRDSPKLESKVRKLSKTPNYSTQPSPVGMDTSTGSDRKVIRKSLTVSSDTAKSKARKSISFRSPSSMMRLKSSSNQKKPATPTVQKMLKDGGENPTSPLKGEMNFDNSKSISSPLVPEVVVKVPKTAPSVEAKSFSSTCSVLCSQNNMNTSIPMECQLDVKNEISSKDSMSAYESRFDILAKIKTLSFMGSRECNWEPERDDGWSWLLLRGRARLTVHFGDRLGRGASATVEAIREESNSIAYLCVHFAVQALQYEAGRLRGAGGVPALLRRSVGVCRVAATWARAMADTELRLAYKLEKEGQLTVQVANVPLRSVWEVCMRIEMCSDRAEAPHPRARDVTVTPLLGRPVPSDSITRAVNAAPEDWGHSLHALWNVFKYLKHKKPEEV